jgi:DNA-binding transcriptional MerR regulator
MVKEKAHTADQALLEDSGLVRISGAARAAGVSRQTIEYYAMIGLFSPVRLPGRPGRFFDEALIRRIRLIRRWNRSGYTLAEIRRMLLRREPPGEG